jgi:hypothetical protein
MKMKMATIAALAAAQLCAAEASVRAAEPSFEAAAGVQPARVGDRAQADPAYDRARADDRREKPAKKRKSTGDKVLTGAAVVLGIGALAVGGLLVALFVS